MAFFCHLDTCHLTILTADNHIQASYRSILGGNQASMVMTLVQVVFIAFNRISLHCHQEFGWFTCPLDRSLRLYRDHRSIYLYCSLNNPLRHGEHLYSVGSLS